MVEDDFHALKVAKICGLGGDAVGSAGKDNFDEGGMADLRFGGMPCDLEESFDVLSEGYGVCEWEWNGCVGKRLGHQIGGWDWG